MNLKILNYKKTIYILKTENRIYKIPYYMKYFSLLKILRYNKINIFYQCNEGYCGCCKVQLIKGKIKYFKKNIIALKKYGYIFSCCCIMKSNIKIKC